MVQERCHDRYDRDFREGVFKSICVDLVQLGVVQYKNTNDPSYGLICGDGRSYFSKVGSRVHKNKF